MSTIERLLKPRSIAIVGASADATKTAGRPLAFLQKHGFPGAVYPVNPRTASISGLRCYPDIESLPEAPDVALVLLGPERAAEAVRALAARGTGTAIVLASGYTETGPVGARRQRELREAAGLMRVLGPNTIGLVNLADAIVLSASGALEMDDLPAGRIAVVSQSGGILGSLLSRAAGRGIGFSRLVATGNEADLDLADFVDYLAGDEATAVIALYMEGLRDPDRFRAAALKAARAGKPVVAFKVGRSEAGARSAVSHTGALAGADRVYDALFRQLGVIRAAAFADLIDIPAALVTGRRLADRRVAILTSTGGAGTLIADGLGVAGFHTPPPDEETAAKLRALQQGDQTVLDRNPIDVTLAGLQPDLLRGAIRALMESPTYDAVIVVVGSSALGRPELMSGALQDCLPASAKPVLAYVSPYAPPIEKLLNQRGVPAFSAPESCTTVLAAMLAAACRPAPVSAVAAPVGPAGAADDLPDGPLNEAEGKRLLARFGVPAVREIAAATPEEAARAAQELGGPVVLKLLSRRLSHKTEAGAVALSVMPGEVSARAAAMKDIVKTRTGIDAEGWLVQEFVAGGAEMILGLHRDPQLGPAVLLGMGGIAAELIGDTTLRLLPIARDDAAAMVKELKTAALLDGFRGRPRLDVAALVDAVVAFAGMAAQLGERLVEAEINPLFVLPAGQGVLAADAVMMLRRP